MSLLSGMEANSSTSGTGVQARTGQVHANFDSSDAAMINLLRKFQDMRKYRAGTDFGFERVGNKGLLEDFWNRDVLCVRETSCLYFQTEKMVGSMLVEARNVACFLRHESFLTGAFSLQQDTMGQVILPGGLVEDEETDVSAMIRILKQSAGVDAEERNLFVGIMVGNTRFFMYDLPDDNPPVWLEPNLRTEWFHIGMETFFSTDSLEDSIKQFLLQSCDSDDSKFVSANQVFAPKVQDDAMIECQNLKLPIWYNPLEPYLHYSQILAHMSEFDLKCEQTTILEEQISRIEEELSGHTDEDDERMYGGTDAENRYWQHQELDDWYYNSD